MTEFAGGIVTGFVGNVTPVVVYVNVMGMYPDVLLRKTQYTLESTEGFIAGIVIPCPLANVEVML